MAGRKRISLVMADTLIAKNGSGSASDLRHKYMLAALRSLMEEGLTQKQKEYIRAYYIEGVDIPEIADRYGVNKSTVSRTIKRGRERIYSVLKYYQRDYKVEYEYEKENVHF